MIGNQISQLSVSTEATDILDDLLKFEYRALLVHVMQILPKFTLHTPRMNHYRKRVLELYAQIHASHTPAQREGKRRDLVDDLMEMHHSDPAFLPKQTSDLHSLLLLLPVITRAARGFFITNC